MDDIKLFAKIWKKWLKPVIKAVRIYNDDIGMESGIKMKIIKTGKRKIFERLELTNKGKSGPSENLGY